MVNNIICLLCTFVFLGIANASDAPKISKIDAPGVGVIQIIHEELGEPIAAPDRLRVVVKCQGANDTREIKLFRMCKFDSFNYEREAKLLTLKLISGRVIFNTGEVVCDLVDQKQIDMRTVCK